MAKSKIGRGDPKPSGAVPGTKDEKAKKEKKPKVKRVSYPGLNKDERGVTTTPLEIFPADFNPKIHKPFRQRDFKDETIFMELKAAEYDKKAARLRRDAKDFRKLGSQVDRVKAKRVIAMQRRLNELKEQLIAENIDIESLLSEQDADANADA